jgi:hypothetical protein
LSAKIFIYCVEEEREEVEKKVGEALDENFSALAEKEKKKKGLTNGAAAGINIFF